MILWSVRAVVLAIEGTTGSASHVRDVLFLYARERFADWLAAHQRGPWTELMEEIRTCAGRSPPRRGGRRRGADRLVRPGRQVPPLKRIQGLVWAEGYACSTLTGHVYDDVPGALARWRQAGIERYVYPSGSVTAQRDWSRAQRPRRPQRAPGRLLRPGRARAAKGSRNPTGPSHVPLGVPAHETVFFSDVGRGAGRGHRRGVEGRGRTAPRDPRGREVPDTRPSRRWTTYSCTDAPDGKRKHGHAPSAATHPGGGRHRRDRRQRLLRAAGRRGRGPDRDALRSAFRRP